MGLMFKIGIRAEQFEDLLKQDMLHLVDNLYLIRVMAFVVKVSNVVLGPHFKNQNFPGSKNCELT